MVTQSLRFAEEIVKTMAFFRMNARMTDRKNDYIVYIKDGDEVSEFLQIVGASQSYLDFESVRVVKDMRNRVNRQVNCETANLQKTVDAAVHQTHMVQRLLQGNTLSSLSPKSGKPAKYGSPIPTPASPNWQPSAALPSPVWPTASKK